MTAPKPPKGFDSWLDWCVQHAEYRDLWIERNCPMGGEQPRYMEEVAQAELAALRARVIAAEDRCDEHVAHVVEIGDVLDAEDGETALEAAKRVMRKLDAATNLIAHTAARVAELAQWKESAMRVLGEHHGALQRHGTLGESTADCMDRLARQVAALVAALRHAVQRNHAPSAGCDGCLGIDAALRAAGRKT